MHFDAFVGPAVVKHYTDAQWYYDYKIWVGLVFYFLVLNYWLIYGYTGNYQRKAVYAIALNLICYTWYNITEIVFFSLRCLAYVLTTSCLFSTDGYQQT